MSYDALNQNALGVLFVQMASVLRRSLDNSLATVSQKLTREMVARAGAIELAGIFPEDQRKR